MLLRIILYPVIVVVNVAKWCFFTARTWALGPSVELIVDGDPYGIIRVGRHKTVIYTVARKGAKRVDIVFDGNLLATVNDVNSGDHGPIHAGGIWWHLRGVG